MEFFDTHITAEAKEYVMDVLNSGHLSEGEMVFRFEKELEKVFGYTFGVATNSATSALHLALVLAGIQQGDEVILPAQTFVATGLAVLYCGAKCVFADIDIDGNIDPYDVWRKITTRTKAVISVSWGGNPCQLKELENVCRTFKIPLIQDNAQALGATYRSLPVSNYGDYSCFSFQAIKHVTSGDGGLLVCKSYENYQRALKLRWFGIDRVKDKPDWTGERKFNLSQIGYKYHMNDVSAAIGLGNLIDAIELQNYRERIAEQYDANLPSQYLCRRDKGSSNWLYTTLVDHPKEFIAKMKELDIPVSVVHRGIDRHDIFESMVDLPIQRQWDARHVCLPCHPGLTPDDVDRVINGFHLAVS